MVSVFFWSSQMYFVFLEISFKLDMIILKCAFPKNIIKNDILNVLTKHFVVQKYLYWKNV